jgi:nucleoside 2-deoxyribosyltransferase
MRHDKPKIYLAGPEVFLPEAAALGQQKKHLCEVHGFEGLFPFDNDPPQGAAGEPIDEQIYRANVALIRQAKLGIVNLTPFRGPSADVGTVFELGLLVGLGKEVFGYTNETSDLLERVKRSRKATFDPVRNAWRDGLRMAIEDFGNADNLMIDQALRIAGNPIVRHKTKPSQRFTDLTAFETCLRRAAEKLQLKEKA